MQECVRRKALVIKAGLKICPLLGSFLADKPGCYNTL